MQDQNKPIPYGNYDKFLAVKCINGTFVGTKTDNIISYKGIPFVGEQPVGNCRWKAPVPYVADDGVYEARHFAKLAVQDKQVMVLDEFDIHPAKESEVKVVDWDRTWFLIKYYML